MSTATQTGDPPSRDTKRFPLEPAVRFAPKAGPLRPQIMEPEISHRTRYSLLSRLKDRDDQVSWQEFFDLYWRLIYDVAVKAGLSDEEAQEVVQETVITVSKKIQDFRNDPSRGTFKGWLMHTTRWRIQDQFRKRNRALGRVQPPPEATSQTAYIERIPDQATADLEAVWDREWEHTILETALAHVRRRIDPERYQIFDLHVRKGWSLQKVADALHLSIGQVHYAKTKVSELLKREMEELKSRFD